MEAPVVGHMERGHGVYLPGLSSLDTPSTVPGESFLWWGVIWISGPPVSDLISYQKKKASSLEFLDNISENTCCMKLKADLQYPYVVNSGPSPCVVSHAEVNKPPSGLEKWMHFQNPENKKPVHPIVDSISEELSTEELPCQVYLVLGLHPLKLAKISLGKSSTSKKWNDTLDGLEKDLF